MRKTMVLLFIFSLCLTVPGRNTVNAGSVPEKGSSFPALTLPVPDRETEREYLGLSGKGPFRVSQIKADIVILEIFSMYCPYCQKEAPNVNNLYELIAKRGDLRNKVKIIGIGAGNTPFEIDIFRKQYDIQFPLFADESFTVHKAVGEVRTPHFFVFRVSPDGSTKIIYSQVGSIQDPNQFLDLIIRESGLQ
jgi:peroxiredoxin